MKKILWFLLRWLGRNWLSLIILWLLINHIIIDMNEHIQINENVVNAYSNLAQGFNELMTRHFPLL
jgi:hypothetical protein